MRTEIQLGRIHYVFVRFCSSCSQHLFVCPIAQYFPDPHAPDPGPVMYRYVCPRLLSYLNAATMKRGLNPPISFI